MGIYDAQPNDADRDGDVDEGAVRFPAPQSNSTMRSDNVAMVKIMKANVPEVNIKSGKK